MPETPPLVRNISDTACWAAIYRARETDRPDALFRDPFARKLAGTRGEEIAAAIPFSERQSWAWVTRTYLFDQFISEQVADGVDMVVNLAAGLDARPYRMKLPAILRWIEVDLPELFDYKESILAGEKPNCALERVRLDLANTEARQKLFARLGAESKKALIITEGLLMYLSAAEVAGLAKDLAAAAGFQRWVLNLVSPALLKRVQKEMNPVLNPGGAFLRFAPEEGAAFFNSHGWKPIDVRSLLLTARKLGRLPRLLRLIALLFGDSPGPKGNRPWSGICLFAKSSA